MYVGIGIHHPLPGKEKLIVDSMRRFGAAMAGKPGFRQAFVLRSDDGRELVGLAIWDSEEAVLAARPEMEAAIRDDDFESWESEPPRAYWYEAIVAHGELGEIGLSE
jgi:hypothetical protein